MKIRDVSKTVLGALTILVGASVPSLAQDGELTVSGFVAADFRYFLQSPLHDGQTGARLNPSLVLQPEVSYEWNNGDDRIDFIPFLRVDSQDHERTHADIRELKYLHVDEGWDLRVGVNKVFWGVIESRHLIDIVNQTDAVEDVDGEDKLGQLMVNVGVQQEWGDLNFLVMPYFRERTFVGKNGRLRGGVTVDTDRAFYENDMGRYHPDLALRYSTYVENWDIGLSHFYGTSREPRFVAGTSQQGDTVLIPHYDIINQTALDVQATYDAWLWKMEGIYRRGQGKSFGAASLGVEYTFFGAVGQSGDLGVLAEYHWDGRDDFAPATSFDDDVFVGARMTLNDVDDTDFLAGVIVDRITQAQSYSMEMDTRLTDQLTLEAELRFSNKLQGKDVSYGARRDHHAQIRLSYYF